MPSAMDNRAAQLRRVHGARAPDDLRVSDPDPTRSSTATRIAEQVIRPTGLLDPVVSVVPTRNRSRLADSTRRGDCTRRKVLVTTSPSAWPKTHELLAKAGYRVQYLHSDIDTIQRIEILRSLRLENSTSWWGSISCVGLDLPEVSLVANPGRGQGRVPSFAQRPYPDHRTRGAHRTMRPCSTRIE